jgi:NtrC-family two-component system sensor histidine kinase KinB
VVHKGQRTERRAAFFGQMLVIAVLVASVLGLLASVSLTTRLLRPLGVVSAAVRRFGQGDTQARAQVLGKDDVAQLAQEFNAMADHLERYRRSSLGDLLQAQLASQAAIDSLPDPVLMLDAAGNLQNTNEVSRRALPIETEGNGGASLNRLDPNLRALIDRLRAHVLGGRGAYHPKGFEDALRITTGGVEHIYLPRATPIYGEHMGVTGAAIVLQDITRLFRFDELKNNLVATVAHEFRTPLTSLRMAIHLCTEEAVGPLTAKQADLLFAAREDCERLQAIVDDLLNLSRLESGRIDLKRKRVEVQSLVDQAVDIHRAVAESRQLVLRTEVYPGLPEAFADPDRLQLVFANLLTNAVRYSPVKSSCGRCPNRPSPAPTPAAMIQLSSASRSATRGPASLPSIATASSRSSSASRAARRVAPGSASSSPAASCRRMGAASAWTASRERAPPSGSASPPPRLGPLDSIHSR